MNYTFPLLCFCAFQRERNCQVRNNLFGCTITQPHGISCLVKWIIKGISMCPQMDYFILELNIKNMFGISKRYLPIHKLGKQKCIYLSLAQLYPFMECISLNLIIKNENYQDREIVMWYSFRNILLFIKNCVYKWGIRRLKQIQNLGKTRLLRR